MPKDTRSTRWLVVAASAVVTAALVIGVGLWISRPAPSTPPQSQSTPVISYFLGGSNAKAWLYPERHNVVGSGGQLNLAVNQALGTPLDADYRTGFPDGTSANVTVRDDTAVIDLRGEAIERDPSRTGRTDGALALQALVHTVAANTDRQLAVSFTVGGRAPGVLLGQELDGPVAPASDDEVLSPVRLDLDEGALLRQRARVTGTASAFEGTVVWQITGDDSDTVIEGGHTTTAECCKPMPFSITLPTLPSGTYVLQVAETDPSGGEGRPPASDTKTFTLG